MGIKKTTNIVKKQPMKWERMFAILYTCQGIDFQNMHNILKTGKRFE
jgi:hypothetical protein